MNDLLRQIQSFTGNQAGIPELTVAVNDLLSQIQNLQASLMNNNYTADATSASAIQSAVVQLVANWAAYVSSSNTTTVDPRLALLADAQGLETILAGLTQEMEAYTESQTEISTFLSLTGDLASQVQDLIANMLNNAYSDDAAVLATLQNFVTQDAAAWAVYKASNTTSTVAASKSKPVKEVIKHNLKFFCIFSINFRTNNSCSDLIN